MSRKKVILTSIAGLVVVAVGVGAYVYTTLDDQTEQGVDSVLADFRKDRPPDAPARDGLPKQGVYPISVIGEETIKSGPLTVDRTLPAQASMIVRHRADGFETEARYSAEHVEIARYGFTNDGTVLTFAITKLKVGPTSTTRERAWTPVLLRFPADSAPGKTWGGAYKSGDLDLTITAKALPDATVTVAGEAVRTDVFEFVQDVKGEFTGSRTETFWYSPEQDLVVRYKIDSSLDGPTDLDFAADQTLTSLTPTV